MYFLTNPGMREFIEITKSIIIVSAETSMWLIMYNWWLRTILWFVFWWMSLNVSKSTCNIFWYWWCSRDMVANWIEAIFIRYIIQQNCCTIWSCIRWRSRYAMSTNTRFLCNNTVTSFIWIFVCTIWSYIRCWTKYWCLCFVCEILLIVLKLLLMGLNISNIASRSTASNSKAYNLFNFKKNYKRKQFAFSKKEKKYNCNYLPKISSLQIVLL